MSAPARKTNTHADRISGGSVVARTSKGNGCQLIGASFLRASCSRRRATTERICSRTLSDRKAVSSVSSRKRSSFVISCILNLYFLMILMKQLALIDFLSAATIVCAADVPITQDELVRRTQELYDSLVSGNQAPWKKHFADDCMFADEKGRFFDKAKLIADITPLPAGYSGTIKVENAQSRIIGNTAILVTTRTRQKRFSVKISKRVTTSLTRGFSATAIGNHRQSGTSLL